MRRLVLIARREVVAYAGAPSFWLAALMGPLLMMVVALGAGSMASGPAQPPAQPVEIITADPALRAAATGALEDAARLEGRRVAIVAKGAASRLTVQRAPDGKVTAAVSGERFSDVTLALLQRDLATAGQAAHAATAIDQPPPAPPPPQDPGRLTRFALTVMLWLVLVGSLGMLLQATVRERSNRALESLLSAARPMEVLFGKLIGVGALSLIVVGVWLGGGAAISATGLAGPSSPADALLHAFTDAQGLAASAGLFALAFAMYGAAVIAVGAFARDVATAQNLSRPVFGVLLLVFFTALGQLSGVVGDSLPALALIPPFTPFVLMLAKPGAIDMAHAAVGVGGMIATTALCGWLGAQALRGELRWPRLGRRTMAAATSAG